MKYLAYALAACTSLSANPAAAQSSVCQAVDGAIVLNDDDEYIGKITNKFGTYGSKFSSESIWNKYGDNGSPYASNSAFNKYTSSPPRIIKNKQVIGYLSANKFVSGAINPIVLGTVCYDFEIDD